MSDHADMSEIRNALKAVDTKIEKNARVLGWVLALTVVSVAASIFSLVVRMQ